MVVPRHTFFLTFILCCYCRRDVSSRSGGGPRVLPPLSPSRHLPANLSTNSFRSSSTSPSISPVRYAFPKNSTSTSPNRDSSSSTLPNESRHVRNLVNLHSQSPRNRTTPAVSLYPDGSSSRIDRFTVTQHSRSSSAPDNSGTQVTRSSHPSSHRDITSVLVSPAHLSNRSSSNTNRRPPETNSRTVSPRRTPRSSESSNNNRRSRTPQRTGGRRERDASRRDARAPSSPPSGSVSSSSSGPSSSNGVSRNPTVAVSNVVNGGAPLPTPCGEANSRRSSARSVAVFDYSR